MLGLPLSSFLLLIVVPASMLVPMFYCSWLIRRGKMD